MILDVIGTRIFKYLFCSKEFEYRAAQLNAAVFF